MTVSWRSGARPPAGRWPGSTGTLSTHDRQRPRFVLRDLGHADIAEHPPRRPLDLLKDGKFCHAGHPDIHQVIVAVTGRGG
jgi:hypothetical protein